MEQDTLPAAEPKPEHVLLLQLVTSPGLDAMLDAAPRAQVGMWGFSRCRTRRSPRSASCPEQEGLAMRMPAQQAGAPPVHEFTARTSSFPKGNGCQRVLGMRPSGGSLYLITSPGMCWCPPAAPRTARGLASACSRPLFLWVCSQTAGAPGSGRRSPRRPAGALAFSHCRTPLPQVLLVLLTAATSRAGIGVLRSI